MNNKVFAVFLGFCMFAVVLAGMFSYMGSDSGKTKSSSNQGASIKDPWIKPEGDAEVLAERYSLDELIERWNVWPRKSGRLSFHSVYAEAIGLYGEDAVDAVVHLEPAVRHSDPNLRRRVMNSLVEIGEDGLSPLYDALEYWPEEDPEKLALNIRWDAAEFLAKGAKKGLDMAEGVSILATTLTHPDSYFMTRGYAADALILMGSPEAVEALKKGRDWFYDQPGLSVEDNAILKKINIALKRF